MAKRRKKIRALGGICFAIYVVISLYFLFFSDYLDRTMVSDEWRYNITPFAEISRFWNNREQLGMSTYLNIGGNILCFIPFGFLLPVMTKKKIFRNILFVSFLAFLCSLSIELVQMVTRVGAFDVDDIILNTIGAIVGYVIMKIAKSQIKI